MLLAGALGLLAETAVRLAEEGLGRWGRNTDPIGCGPVAGGGPIGGDGCQAGARRDRCVGTNPLGSVARRCEPRSHQQENESGYELPDLHGEFLLYMLRCCKIGRRDT